MHTIGVGSATKDVGGVAESTRVIGNYLEMVDSVDRERDGWTLDKGKMDSTKRTWRE